MTVESVTLEGQFVRLEPMRLDHHSALCAIGLDKELWLWTVNQCTTPEDMAKYMETALDEAERGVSLPFVTVDRKIGTVVGSTRFGNIDLRNKKAEIGWTWINTEWQRTYINTEAKLLMLTHAFEVWECNRVELKTDRLNERSRNAIGRLGATEEGILRSHMLTDSGRIRDTVYFSILRSEWPEIKQRLEERLRKGS
jgi:RimJ/RimL family protein N-acetyltransferase